MRFAAFYAQLNWLQNVGNRFLNFCPQNFLEPPKVKKNFEKKIWISEGSKNFWGKNSKFCFQRFVANFVVRIMPQTASRYLKNCRRSSIFREPLLFQQKLATLQTGNSANFQNILNRLSNRCPLRGYNCFGIILIFKKKSYRGGHLKLCNL